MKCFQIKITQTMYSQRVLDKWTESSVLKRPPFAAANAGNNWPRPKLTVLIFLQF
jgi:hypothetical protein